MKNYKALIRFAGILIGIYSFVKIFSLCSGITFNIPPIFIFSAFAYVAIVYFIYINQSSPSPQPYTEDETKLKDIDSYLLVDMTFSPEKLRKRLSDTYTLSQKCLQDKDLSPLRLRLTDGLYSQMDMQLDQYRKKHQTNHLERMSVRRLDILGWKQDGDYDMILAELETRVIDYVTDDITGEMVGGTTEEFKYSTYECTLIRKRGGSALTSRSELKKCPHCGAHVMINSSTKCDYCGSVISNPVMEWSLSNIKLLKQRRVDKNITRGEK